MPSALEIAVEILVRTQYQKFKRALIQHAVGQQAQQIAHTEFIDLDADQITHLGFTSVGLAMNGIFDAGPHSQLICCGGISLAVSSSRLPVGGEPPRSLLLDRW